MKLKETAVGSLSPALAILLHFSPCKHTEQLTDLTAYLLLCARMLGQPTPLLQSKLDLLLFGLWYSWPSSWAV